MRVLIVGEEAPGALSDSYARAFRSLGAEVRRFCPRRAYAEALPLPGAGTRVGKRLLRAVALPVFNRRVRDELADERADLVLVVKGEELSAETVRWLRERTGAPVVNFYPDDPFGEARSNRMAYGTETLAAYDACFTFARHLFPAYRHAGVERVHYLPFARDPDQHSPPEAPGEPEFEVVFVGNLDAERVRWLEPLAAAGLRLAVFGEHTTAALPGRSPLRAATFLPASYGAGLARALARGAVSLNVMRLQNAGSHNMRSFESPACGAFTLSQRTPELAELFREGEEVALFGSPEEMVAEARRWLADPEGRRRVAEAGFRRVEHDTYAARAAEVLRRVGPAVPAGAP
ncbi:MAG TPA: glycosyltransferase [Longimicrobiaceae bacterium]